MPSLIGPQYLDLTNGSVVDKVTPDMLHLIHPYWNRFAPMDPLMTKILGTFLAMAGVLSFFGNGMVVYIFSTTKALRTPANLLVLNLAFSDFSMMATACPMITINLFHETWVLGPLVCDIYGMLGSIFGCASIWTMCMIAVDRFEVIVKGVAGRPMTVKLAVVKIIGIWVFSAFWTVAPMLGWSRYVPEGNLTSCGVDYLTQDWNPKSYLIAYTIACYILPFFLICYSYWFIMAAVSAHEKAMREQAKKMNVKSLRSSEDANKSTEGKLAKIALISISLWFLSWTPYGILNFMGFFESDALTPTISIWGAAFAKAGSSYNPVVYGISHPKYRLALRERFSCLVCGKTEEPVKSEISSEATIKEQETST
ncbi:opsin Rh1-like isoform X1 [Episyrphus balteatus]|uniref:opsin Rh1-like isoform X1 n=1 Tax=Episyrphus balteatus TaxID=286459 RepID=UPI002485D471|nr:opsin Rh1-like isoform X1 [Episyrphus balteatus]XP_055839714.1 opsin Rh1-like isoform X1 [Episyrphus balteatus]XP_055839715.1 opsin Rh1-like isoform X1 [Episyrphus balteatus]